MGGRARGRQSRGECRDLDRLIANRNTQSVLDFRGDGIPIELFGTEQRIDLAIMRIGVLQDRRNHFGLIDRRDGGVTDISEGQPVDAFAARADPERVQPFHKVGGSQMRGDNRRAIQQPVRRSNVAGRHCWWLRAAPRFATC
ncbi:MAG: hypothetical protein QOE94_844 [Mycobacterium sp.]|nr:hypothetical protein [Mycobacterium sp.]